MPGPLHDLGRDFEAPAARSAPTGNAVADAAARLVGRSKIVVDGRSYRWDCSGLAIAALADAGIEASGSTADLWAQAEAAGRTHRRKRPAPGELAFFDDTYDRNDNGRLDDPLSHVAVVERVDPDGTITLIHVGSAGIVRFVMNLVFPHDELRDGARVNDLLRAASRRDPPGAKHLASELWVGFAAYEAAVAGR